MYLTDGIWKEAEKKEPKLAKTKAGPMKKVKLMVKIIGVPKKLFNSVMLPKTTQALSGIESLGKNCVDSKA